MARLAHYGPRAVVVLETALYDADVPGRLRVVKALAATRDPHALPVLEHLARRDEDPRVRAAAKDAEARLH
jgi:HEAT repeat protein